VGVEKRLTLFFLVGNYVLVGSRQFAVGSGCGEKIDFTFSIGNCDLVGSSQLAVSFFEMKVFGFQVEFIVISAEGSSF